MKQKKASAELRKRALELFTRGFRFESVAKKLGIDRMVVWRWMSLFDINDLRWLDPSWRRKTSMAERIEIVKDYLEFKEALQNPLLPSRMKQKCSVRFFRTASKNAVFLP